MPKRLRSFLLTGLLLVMASALLALLAGEWLYLKKQRTQPARKEPAAAAPLPEAGLLPDDFALPELNQYEQFVSRPLFMESRRPGQPPAAEPPPPPPPETPPPISLKLMGVLSMPTGRMALIADDKGKYKRMRLNDVLDGWQIAEIKPDRARMEQSGFKEELPLLKKHEKGPGGPGAPGPGGRPPAAPPAAPPPQAPPPQPPARPYRQPAPVQGQGPGVGRYPPAQPPAPEYQAPMEVPDGQDEMPPDTDDGYQEFDQGQPIMR